MLRKQTLAQMILVTYWLRRVPNFNSEANVILLEFCIKILNNCMQSFTLL